MFSNNEKISSRQIKRLLVFDLFGISSLLLPQQLAKAGNGAGIWSIAGGAVLAGLYLWLIHANCRAAAQDYLQYLKTGWGSFLSRLVFLFYAFISILCCAWTAKLLSELMCDSLLDNKEFAVALFFILLLALYGGIAGLEARARIYEVMFWVLVIPLAVMLLLCIRQVQMIQWFPIAIQSGEGGWSGFLSGTLRCFTAFLPLTFLLFLVPHVQNPGKSSRAAAWALVISGAALFVIYLILLGIFGSGALAEERFAVITLMGMVKLPGDFLKRLDAVMVGVWFFTLYALIGTTLYYGVVNLRKVFMKQPGADVRRKRKSGRYRSAWFVTVAAAVYAAAYGFYLWPWTEDAAEKLFYTAGVPFLILVPLLSLFLCRAGQNKKE